MATPTHHRRPEADQRRDPELIKAIPLRHPGRWVAAMVIIALGLIALHSVATNERFHWSTYVAYLFDKRISEGAWVTLQITVLAMALAVILGVILAVMRMSPNPVLQSSALAYLWVFRGTPVYVQLVFWGLFASIYPTLTLGIPSVADFVQIDIQHLEAAFFFAVVGLGLNEAAYMAEIVRAGIGSVGEGQTEAATALGMPWSMSMRRIVLPQAMRVIIPPTGNELISMLKTTSLVIAVPVTVDLYSQASQIAGVNYRPVPLLLVASTWYLVITTVLMVGQYFLEKKFSKGASRTMSRKQLQTLADELADTKGRAR
jgi:polar amino acid transport system permease protein